MSKNVKKIWENRKEILEGIKNSVFKKEAIEEIASERNNICKTCPSYDIKGLECSVKGTQPCCGECGCSLQIKQRSMSSDCPLDKWKALLTEEEELDHDALNPEFYA